MSKLIWLLALGLGLCGLVNTPREAGEALAADWTQFRGPNGSSVSDEKNLPTKWSDTENIRWKAELPGRGLSNPVIAGGKVFVTASSGYRENRLHVLCFDAGTGAKLWERQFTSTGNTGCHPKTCMAAPTPVTDGKNVYALFATTDVAALDGDGNLLWYRSLVSDYPTVSNQVGMAASPMLVGDAVVIPMENVGESFVLALDKKTGENKWKVDRQRAINWVTPLTMTSASKPALLLQSATDLGAYDPETGKSRWVFATHDASTISSAVTGDGMVFIPGKEFCAIKPGEDGVTPELLWKSGKFSLDYASPVYHKGKLYLLRKNNVACVNAQTGEELWKERVDGPLSATPVLADGKLYMVNEKGTTKVIQLGDEPKVLATNKIDDTILATPAISGGAIYLRSDKYLYCIGEKKK